MAKIDHRRLPLKHYERYVALMEHTLQRCGCTDDGQRLLQSLFVESEVVMFARRLQIAKLLLLGRTFDKIREELSVGLDTIMAVDRWLDRKIHAYRRIIAPATKAVTASRGSTSLDFSGLGLLKKKYPAHFLLINLLLFLGEDSTSPEAS